MKQKLSGRICGAGLVSTGLIFSVLLAAPSCDDDDDAQRVDAGVDGAVRDAAVSTDSLSAPDAMQVTDGEIVGVMATVNEGEIQQGTLAASKARASSVRMFGSMMVMHHTVAQQRQATLATAAGIAPAPSAIKQMLQTKNAAKVMELNLVNLPAFDVLYIEGQIMAHQEVLTLLDTTFLPQAKNAALRADLMVARGEVAMHLAEAKSIRVALGSPGNPDGGTDGGGDASGASGDR